MDCNFPHIVYEQDRTPRDHGLYHGEEHRQAIQELANIRKELMLAKNPSLKDNLDALAHEQFQYTQKLSDDLAQEFTGIMEGAQVSLTDLVILNNYTDFRDITLVDEGCTTVAINKKEIVSGQTWDMHASAKNYLTTLELTDGTILLSLTGCLGMMGVNTSGLFFGVNNLNTKKAMSGVIWPALVRHCLRQPRLQVMEQELAKSQVTSGHNYLLSDGEQAYHIEKAPGLYEIASQLESNEQGVIFHTNHCLTPEGQEVQDTISVNSTTHERHELMTTFQHQLQTEQDLIDTLQSHEGYPKSICSHYQSGAQDPSTTCGGGVYNHKTRRLTVWRGCPHEDKNYLTRDHEIKK